jgi:hypothetical protein
MFSPIPSTHSLTHVPQHPFYFCIDEREGERERERETERKRERVCVCVRERDREREKERERERKRERERERKNASALSLHFFSFLFFSFLFFSFLFFLVFLKLLLLKKRLGDPTRNLLRRKGIKVTHRTPHPHTPPPLLNLSLKIVEEEMLMDNFGLIFSMIF